MRLPALAPATVTATALTATAAALLLLPAPRAAAATEGRWDAVARCESNNRWATDTGNGFSGGLQFVPSTWEEFGGLRYADRAHRATKYQQLAVAERVLRGQGEKAWPECGPRAGLTRAQAEPGRWDGLADRRVHQVEPGETLASIARRYRVPGGWKAVHRANREALPDPGRIRAGQRLVVPAS